MNDGLFLVALQVLRLDEGMGLPGRAGMPYKDSKGYWTIGIGHLIGPFLTELKLSENIIMELFKEDLSIAIDSAKLLLKDGLWERMGVARKVAMVSMLYTLGINKFSKFKETLDLINNERWGDVAEHILTLKWAKDIDPRQRPGVGRDDRIAHMFRTDTLHEDYIKVRVAGQKNI
jgi:lysozyme